MFRMLMLLIATCFSLGLGSPLAHSVPSTSPHIATVLSNLNLQAFELTGIHLRDFDRLTNKALSRMETCPYQSTLLDNFKRGILRLDCDEYVEKKVDTDKVPYFLLAKKIRENESMNQHRKDHLQDIIAEAYDVNISPELLELREEVIAYLSSELESCTSNDSSEIESVEDGFLCQVLIEEAKNQGLSYYQISEAIDQYVERLSYSSAPVSTPPNNNTRRQVTRKP